MQYDAIHFDLDGTLLDTLGDIAQSTNHVRASYALSTLSLDQVRAAVGHGLEHLLRTTLTSDGLEWSSALRDEAIERYSVHHQANLRVHTRPYPGVPEGLQRLRARELPLTVVSNKPVRYCVQLIEHYFPRQFAVTLGADSVPNKKPAPDMLLAACEELSLHPERCVMVGDSPGDLEAGRNAGFAACLGVTWGFRQAELLAPLADELFDRFEDLVQRLC